MLMFVTLNYKQSGFLAQRLEREKKNISTHWDFRIYDLPLPQLNFLLCFVFVTVCNFIGTRNFRFSSSLSLAIIQPLF